MPQKSTRKEKDPRIIKDEQFALVSVSYDTSEQSIIDEIENAVRQRLATKPRRLAHSLSVANTAEAMAMRYGASPFEARIAGLLHDWDKVLSSSEQLAKARYLGIDLGVPLEQVTPLLHGLTAARELERRYPTLPASVLQAIARHTIGAADMTTLDMVIFIADTIEPRRPGIPSIEEERSMVVKSTPLEDVYWSAFSRGIIYVIETGRFLYPGTIDIYNKLVARSVGRRQKKG